MIERNQADVHRDGDVRLEDRPPPEADGSGRRFLPTAVGVVRSPAVTFRAIAEHEPVGQAVAVVAAILALLAVVQGVEIVTDPAVAPQLPRAALVGALLAGVPFGLVGFLVWTAAVLLCARLLGGDGTFSGTLSGLGFAYVPMVLAVVALPLAVPLGGLAGVVVVPVLLGAALWSYVLDVFAVREVHRLSTGRAVGAVVLPIVASWLLIALFLAALLLPLVTAG